MTSTLKEKNITASAPCRVDMGGTLDISTFYFPLSHLSPCTFNIAIGLRTRVRLFPYNEGLVKVSSSGFESAEYPLDEAPFDHPLGLMFAIAAYFRAGGVHIDIDSSSPPRSALGGSSSAAVALIKALSQAGKESGAPTLSRQQIAILAHMIEASVAGVPCGLQDQLAAVCGGVNVWYWQTSPDQPLFRKKAIQKEHLYNEFEKHLLLAYCGVPHQSKDINNKWVHQFVSGNNRDFWTEIALCTTRFVKALEDGNLSEALTSMNREMIIRRKMTPEVLDAVGENLVESAVKNNCSARFTGAGGGGCIWALGEIEDIDKLKGIWERDLSTKNEARLLDVKIDSKGVLCEENGRN